MKKLFSLLCALMLLPSLAFPCPAAEEHPEYTARTLTAIDCFSTISTLVIYDDFRQPGREEALKQTWEEVKALLSSLDAVLSLSREDSDPSRFSRLSDGESMTISADTLQVLTRAREVNLLSGGLYDPTVSRLVDLYGFSPRFSDADYAPRLPYDRPRLSGRSFAPPEEKYVCAFQSLVSFPLLEGDTLTGTASGVEVDGQVYSQTLDLGGIGKGYAVDCVLSLLRERGYQYGYFSCGGSSVGVLNRAVASKGAPQPAQWGIAMEKPRFSEDADRTALRVFTQNRCLSTSGDDIHSYYVNGQRYCHLIDPNTGAPVNPAEQGVQKGICTASVYGENAALCDAWSTAICVAGLDTTLEWINSGVLDGYDVVLILYREDAPFCEIVTTFPEESIQIVDSAHFRPTCQWQDGVLTYTGSLLSGE